MSLTNLSLLFRQLQQLSTSANLLLGLASCSFPQNYFGWPAFLLCLVDSIIFFRQGICLVYLSHNSHSFRISRVVLEESVFGPVFLFLLIMIFLRLYLFLSAALFVLTTWPSGSPPPGPCRYKGHTRSSVSTGALV